ncbi:hypothetical protein GCM10011428_33090 [Streptomyces violaceus]
MGVARPGGEREDQPEELIAAAHSSCYSMAFSNILNKAGTPPTKLVTSADVSFQPGEGITGIHLTVEGTVPGIDEAGFLAAAEEAKVGCPVSQALKARRHADRQARLTRNTPVARARPPGAARASSSVRHPRPG